MTKHNFSVMLGAKIQVLKHTIHFKIGSKSPSELFCDLNLVCRLLRSHLFFKVNKRFGSVPWNNKCTFGFGPEGGSANTACDYGPGPYQAQGIKHSLYPREFMLQQDKQMNK